MIFTRNDGYRIILAAIMVPLLIVFIPQIQIEFAGFTDNTKHFLSAFGASLVGIVLFFLKKYVERKRNNFTENQTKEKNDATQQIFSIDLFEVFMFMMMPTLASYGLIPDLIKQFPYLITIILFVATSFWFFPSLWYVYKRYGLDDGKIVKGHITIFGLNLFIMGIGFTLLIWFIESLPKIPSQN